MGTLSLNKASRLFWLGRYLERTYTTLRVTRAIYDADIDGQEADYTCFCHKMGIPAAYSNTADFCRRFYFDITDPNSVASSLTFANDNAIVLRETLHSEALAYIQLALSAMKTASESPAPGVGLQWVQDDIMAFRGCCEETIDSEEARNILKAGTSMERVDLYLRLDEDYGRCAEEFRRLFNRLYKTSLRRNENSLRLLTDTFLDEDAPQLPRATLLGAVESLFADV